MLPITKSLKELGVDDAFTPDDYPLKSRAMAASVKPLSELTIEDIRLLTSQLIGLNYVIPIALERLEEDPIVSGDFYQGDLLSAVLSVEKEFWLKNPVLLERFRRLVRDVSETITYLSGRIANFEERMPTGDVIERNAQ